MSRSEALVLAGHGSQRHPGTAAPLHAHADRIRARGLFTEVRTAFWKEEPALRDVAGTLRSEVAYVVPVLTSEGYFADEVFPRELGVRSEPTPVQIQYADPVGTHDAMTDVILERVESAIEGPDADAGVALVGHGTDRHARSDRATRDHAARIDALDRYAEVSALFLDEAPFVSDLSAHIAADEVAVVPVFIADGYHTARDIPDAIGHPGTGQTAEIGGQRVHYAGAVGTEPRLADLIVDRAIDAGARADPSGTPAGPAAGADEAFIAWNEGHHEARQWGELVIGHGAKGFELRHRDDDATDRARLSLLEAVPALRERVRRDDRGRYRPLSGARSLPTGWVLGGLDGEGLLRAVQAVYPGSVAHWFRSRQGGLSSTPFRKTASSQTGEYADLASVETEEVATLAEAVCGNCVRRREWAVDDRESTDAGRSDGAVPCREACPFFLSAAVALNDVDGPVADCEDPAVPAAAFDEPGNRYRVRHAGARAHHYAESAPLSPGGDD